MSRVCCCSNCVEYHQCPCVFGISAMIATDSMTTGNARQSRARIFEKNNNFTTWFICMYIWCYAMQLYQPRILTVGMVGNSRSCTAASVVVRCCVRLT